MGLSFRADHVGSFLRPTELLAARRDPQTTPERLRALEDRHILQVLERQRELGLEIFTDGELRRRGFMSDLTDAVEGFDFGTGVERAWQGSDAATPQGTLPGVVSAPLRRTRRMTAHEVEFLRAHSPGPIKVTLPSATQFPAIAFKAGITDRVYPDHSALLWAIVEIVAAEVGALAAEGIPYVQIDAPRYSYYLDPGWRDWLRANVGRDPDALLDEAIAADNATLRAAQGNGTTLAIHLCRGNNRSHWYAAGGYDAIAEKVFGSLEVDRFLLEYDDDRSGTFAPLRFVPKGKTVVLGLISSKLPALEEPDALARRIEEAAKLVPIDRLALSPQCGFASTMEGNLVTERDQWAKLGLVVETARRVWG